MYRHEGQRLIDRVAPLTFAIFASRSLESGQVTRDGGSGVFIAPFMAITAKHVAEDLLRLDDRTTVPKRPFVTQHAAGLFQTLDPRTEGGDKALWHVDRSWTSNSSDLILLQVSAESERADSLQYKMPVRPLPWRLLPPPVGATVHAFGFPGSTVRTDGEQLGIDAHFTLQELEVGTPYPNGRDRGMLHFPCFEVRGSLAPGFSGGPVVYEGHLCGIVTSGSSFDERSYVASLWPLCLMEFDNELSMKTTFGDLLDRRVIDSSDWSNVKPRIAKTKDHDGRVVVSIKDVV